MGPLLNFELSEIRLKGSEGLSKIGNFIYLLTASHNIHRLAWGPYAHEAQGNCPVCPCIKMALTIFTNYNFSICKKSLKIPKGQSESVNRRRSDNTMAKKKVQKDKQRSTKHTHKTKDWVIRTPLKTSRELRCSGRIRSGAVLKC